MCHWKTYPNITKQLNEITKSSTTTHSFYIYYIYVCAFEMSSCIFLKFKINKKIVFCNGRKMCCIWFGENPINEKFPSWTASKADLPHSSMRSTYQHQHTSMQINWMYQRKNEINEKSMGSTRINSDQLGSLAETERNSDQRSFRACFFRVAK